MYSFALDIADLLVLTSLVNILPKIMLQAALQEPLPMVKRRYLYLFERVTVRTVKLMNSVCAVIRHS